MKAKAMRRMYLREAAVMLAVAKLAIRLFSAAPLVAWASRPPRRINRFNVREDSGWVSWAVETVGDKRWMRATCLARALAAQTMLRRRGIASRLCLGVAREGKELSAHAWIELGQEAVVGGREATAFTRLVEFGGGRA
jgi:hypothetical protein